MPFIEYSREKLSCPCGEGEFEKITYVNEKGKEIIKAIMICPQCKSRYVWHEEKWQLVDSSSSFIPQSEKRVIGEKINEIDSQKITKLLEIAEKQETEKKTGRVLEWILVIAIILFIIFIIWMWPRGLSDFFDRLFS